jgi:hypothetical protein
VTAWTGTIPSLGALHAPTAGELEQITGALGALTGAWTPFTPVWTGSSSNPAIGNGTLAGAYMQAGKLVHYVGRMFAGSTTTFGSGNYDMSLPVAGADADLGIGTCLLYDSSAAAARYGGAAVFDTTAMIRFYAGTGGIVTNLAPFTWANGDRLQWFITYEAA